MRANVSVQTLVVRNIFHNLCYAKGAVAPRCFGFWLVDMLEQYLHRRLHQFGAG